MRTILLAAVGLTLATTLATTVTATLAPAAGTAATPHAKPPALANSAKGFSNQQGLHGWSYGYYASPPDPSTFTLMTQYAAQDAGCGKKVWLEQCGAYWTQISKKTSHPQSPSTSGGRTPVLQWAVRRWTSPSAAQVTISGRLAKQTTTCGDGVEGHLIVDGQEVWSGTVASNDATGVTYTVAADLSAGSTVDLALDPRGDDLCDLSVFSATIRGT